MHRPREQDDTNDLHEDKPPDRFDEGIMIIEPEYA